MCVQLQINPIEFKIYDSGKVKVSAIFKANLPLIITPNQRTKNTFIIHLFVEIVITWYIMKQKDD